MGDVKQVRHHRWVAQSDDKKLNAKSGVGKKCHLRNLFFFSFLKNANKLPTSLLQEILTMTKPSSCQKLGQKASSCYLAFFSLFSLLRPNPYYSISVSHPFLFISCICLCFTYTNRHTETPVEFCHCPSASVCSQFPNCFYINGSSAFFSDRHQFF